MWGTCGLAWMVRCSKPLLQQSSNMCVECMVRRSKLDSAKFEYKRKTKISAERSDGRCSDVWWDVLGWLDSAKFESDECWNRVNVLSLPKQSSNKQPKPEQNLRGSQSHEENRRWPRPLPFGHCLALRYSFTLCCWCCYCCWFCCCGWCCWLLVLLMSDFWCLISDVCCLILILNWSCCWIWCHHIHRRIAFCKRKWLHESFSPGKTLVHGSK